MRTNQFTPSIFRLLEPFERLSRSTNRHVQVHIKIQETFFEEYLLSILKDPQWIRIPDQKVKVRMMVKAKEFMLFEDKLGLNYEKFLDSPVFYSND